MPTNVDDGFYDRADAHIQLSNDQLRTVDSRGKVSASMLFGTARYTAWISACKVSSAEEMSAARDETVKYFCEQYRLMLEENLDDYIANFERYMGR